MSTTSKIPFANTIEVQRNAGFHNSIFRGKFLGTSFTEAQSAAIQAGTFDDLFIGDYWTIYGMDWVIADFDTYFRFGDTALNTHHLAVIPRTILYSAEWNTTDDTSTGYVGSAIRANIKGDNTSTSGAEAKFIAVFGDAHVLSYRAIYPTAYSNGAATEWASTDARVELMNEVEIYGFQMWGANRLEVGTDSSQFSLFRLSKQHIVIRNTWLLRDVSTAAKVSSISAAGFPTWINASFSRGVRPFALIA